MKKFTALILSALMITVGLCSCAGTDKIEITGSEISASGEVSLVKFTLANKTGGAISELSVDIETFDENSQKIQSEKAQYPLEVGNGASATLSVKGSSKCESAKAVSFSYKKANGKTVTGSFKANNTATLVVTTTSDGKIRTRQELSEKLLSDIKSYFLKNKFYADGEYNAQTNQLIVAAYCDLSYKDCANSYKNSPEQWDDLAENMTLMSKTCLAEFKSYGFNDVQVNIAMMSKDDMPVLSVIDGEVDITPGNGE